MNAFDLVVTVSLGSTLATIMVSKQTPLADGLVALLVLLQYSVLAGGTASVVPPDNQK